MKNKALLFLLLVLSSPSSLWADDAFLWEGGRDNGDMWKFSPYLGWISTDLYPWIWVYSEQAWLWVSDQGDNNDASNVWCWDYEIGAWRWQDLNGYPWVAYWTGINNEWVYLNSSDEGIGYYMNSREEFLSSENLSAYCAGMSFVEGGTRSMSIGTTSVSDFYISRTEVTWEEWKKVRSWAVDNGYDIGSAGDACDDDHPVHSVSWYDVLKWCNAKSEMEGLSVVYTYLNSVYKSGEEEPIWDRSADGYRLARESEWEFAAGGGNQTHDYIYSGSNTIEDVAWYRSNSSGAHCSLSEGKGTWPVAQKQSNELGLYDMTGNVLEWCWDRSPLNESLRTKRGGSWDHSAFYSTVFMFNYFYYFADQRRNTSGFRIVRNSGQEL